MGRLGQLLNSPASPPGGVIGLVWACLYTLMIAPVAVWITIATATILDGARRYGW